MRWSITIGRFGGTAVKIHITFILFLAWIAFSAWTRGGPTAALDSTAFIVLLFACVVLHEFGHITAARRYGIGTPEVTPLPIGGVASLQRIPSDPVQELVVALAGPAVNLVIGLLLIALLGGLNLHDLAQIDNPNLSLMGRLAIANLFLFAFNLIPAFPMDGGAFCMRCSRCGSAGLPRPKWRRRSVKRSPSASAFSACSAIRCSCSSRSLFMSRRLAKRR
jgi:Zn-dependent protease